MKRNSGIILLICLLSVALILGGCGQSATGEKTQGEQAAEGEKETPAVEYPTKSITIIVHSSPGAGADLFGRQVGQALQEVLGKSVVVENRTGGSGAIAMQFVGEAKADGYTLLGITDTLLITPLRNDVPKSMADMTPVARLVVDGDVVYVKADSKWDSESLLAAIKGEGPKVKCGSPQAGSPEAIAIESLIKKYNANINQVAYADAAKSLVGVLNGDVDFSIAEPAEILPQLEAGEVRVLMAFNSERVPAFPDAPTFMESGYPDITVDKFRGFAVPKGTPEEVIKVLEDAFKGVLANANYKKAYTQNLQIPSYLNSTDFQEFLDKTTANYKAYFEAQK